MGAVHGILQLKEAVGGQIGCGDADVLGDYAGQRADKMLSHRPGGRFIGYGEDAGVVNHEAPPKSSAGTDVVAALPWPPLPVSIDYILYVGHC